MTQIRDSERLLEVAEGVELNAFDFFAGSSAAKRSLEGLREASDTLAAFVAEVAECGSDTDPDITSRLRVVSEDIDEFADQVDVRYALSSIRREIGLHEIAASNARLNVVGWRNVSAAEGIAIATETRRLLNHAIDTLSAARKRALRKFADRETRQLKAQIVDFLKRAAAGDREHDIDELDIHSLHKACDDWIDFHAAGAAGDGHHEQLAAVLAHCFRLATGKTVDPA